MRHYLKAIGGYQKVETVTSSVDSHANLEYKKDYDLGDYCTYINTEIGIAAGIAVINSVPNVVKGIGENRPAIFCLTVSPKNLALLMK